MTKSSLINSLTDVINVVLVYCYSTNLFQTLEFFTKSPGILNNTLKFISTSKYTYSYTNKNMFIFIDTT